MDFHSKGTQILYKNMCLLLMNSSGWMKCSTKMRNNTSLRPPGDRDWSVYITTASLWSKLTFSLSLYYIFCPHALNILVLFLFNIWSWIYAAWCHMMCHSFFSMVFFLEYITGVLMVCRFKKNAHIAWLNILYIRCIYINIICHERKTSP